MASSSWVANTQRERQRLERQLGQHVPGEQLTSDRVNALVAALKDIVTVLGDAEPTDKSELYDQLGSPSPTTQTGPRRSSHGPV